MPGPKVVYRSPTGATVWAIPGSDITIMWGGPGSRLRIGACLVAGGATTTIDHPAACDEYRTAKDAAKAVTAFIAANNDDDGGRPEREWPAYDVRRNDDE